MTVTGSTLIHSTGPALPALMKIGPRLSSVLCAITPDPIVCWLSPSNWHRNLRVNNHPQNLLTRTGTTGGLLLATWLVKE